MAFEINCLLTINAYHGLYDPPIILPLTPRFRMFPSGHTVILSRAHHREGRALKVRSLTFIFDANFHDNVGMLFHSVLRSHQSNRRLLRLYSTHPW